MTRRLARYRSVTDFQGTRSMVHVKIVMGADDVPDAVTTRIHITMSANVEPDTWRPRRVHLDVRNGDGEGFGARDVVDYDLTWLEEDAVAAAVPAIIAHVGPCTLGTSFKIHVRGAEIQVPVCARSLAR